jgi:PAS domain S-box-containing protein
LVTGAVSEDRAIDILTQGAKDYVLKSRLAQRLVPAVKRALAEADEHRARKQAEAELRESHRTLMEANESLNAEIAERRRIQEELQQATQILRAISQYSPDLVYAKDTQCRLVYASESTLRVLGKSPQEVMGKTDVEFHADPHLGSAVMENDRIVRETRRTLVVEEPTCMPDGTTRVFHSTKVPWIAEDGTLMGTFGISVDIHELKQAEEALKTANETLEQRVAERVAELEAEIASRKQAEEAVAAAQRQIQGIIDNTPAIIYAFDLEGRFVMANAAVSELLNSTPERMIGKRRHDFMPKQDADQHEANDRQVIEAGKALEFEEYSQFKDRSITWFTTKFPLRDAQGRIYAVAGISADVSERKQAQEILRESEERYRGVVENTTAIILRLDPRGVINFANSRALEFFGYTADELIGRHAVGSIVPARESTGRDLTAMVDQIAADPDRFHSNANENICRDGRRVWLEWTNSGIYRADGRLKELLCVGIDATVRKQAEETLKEKTKQLEDANRELESFSYSVSHDLRAPLRAIDGYSRMILKKQGEQLDEETRQRLQMIRDNTDKMGRLIDDLLALSRLGSQAVTKKSFNMEELISKVWSELLAMHPARKMTLQNGPLPVAWGDRSLIWQVYSNLLGNAVKFTHGRESPLIETGGFVQNGEVIFYVRDNGIGFDMKFYDKLFGAFQRLHRADAYEGTGIGLALVQRIIHRHGGRVWAEGEVDKGATFYFTLPTGQE